MPRYCRFTALGRHAWGLVEDGGVQPVDKSSFDGGTPRPFGEFLPFEIIELGIPATPTKIVCVGRNYADHARELGNALPEEPLIFLKPPSALLPHEGIIRYPVGQSQLVHHEGELAVVIGRPASHVREEDALQHVVGYTVLNDVTARDLQRRDGQFTRGKGFDTFCPVGPWLDTDFVPRAQRISVTVNGELRQEGHLDQMIFSIPRLIAFISSVMTLERGDLIATGTPAGVGPLVPGDRVEVTIDELGTLRNTVG